MRRRRHRVPHLLGTLAMLGACGHSEPFTTSDTGLTKPFSATAPVRLTYAAGANLWPGFSEDGREVTYSFVRGTPDRDRCLGTLPAGGGTRTRTLCWTPLGHDTLADGIEIGALGADDRLAFTRHTSRTNQIVANDAALYLARGSNPLDAERILDLLTFRPEAGIAWDYLLDLTWSGPEELTALATDVILANLCSPGICWDTSHVALHVATLNTATRPITIAATPVGPSARGIAVDRSSGNRLVAYPDRVVRLTGGGEIPVYTPTALPDRLNPNVTAVAAGGGRVVIAERWIEPGAGGSQTPVRRLVRIDGTAPVELARWVGVQGEFGRLAMDPGGRQLIFEGRQTAARHLYQLELP